MIIYKRKRNRGTEIKYPKRKKDSTLPIYGIFALVFDMIGLLLISFIGFTPNFKYSFNSLYATPFTIVGIIYGYVEYKRKKDTTLRLAQLGIFLGIILFSISTLPLLPFILLIVWGGWKLKKRKKRIN